jgi:hypothetical protein
MVNTVMARRAALLRSMSNAETVDCRYWPPVKTTAGNGSPVLGAVTDGW